MDTTSAKTKVLVVDDEMDFTYIIKLTLEGTGQFQVRTLNLPSQVIPVARDFKPDLVLLDCMMPGVDGGEVAAAIQRDPLLKDTPFAFFTATVSEPETVTSRCYEGPQEYLPKTIKMEDLVNFIERKTSAKAPPAPQANPPAEHAPVHPR
jgi:two-component system, OmpR family, response regulator